MSRVIGLANRYLRGDSVGLFWQGRISVKLRPQRMRTASSHSLVMQRHYLDRLKLRSVLLLPNSVSEPQMRAPIGLTSGLMLGKLACVV